METGSKPTSGTSSGPALLKRSDLNPAELADRQVAAMTFDIGKLIAQKPKFVEVPCPACESREHDSLYEKYGFRHVACRGCVTQYISPRPTSDLLRDHYSNSTEYEFYATHIFPRSAKARKERIFVPRARLVADLAKKHGFSTDLLVEVGPAYGFFCEAIQELGLFKRIIGIEPTPHHAALCREKGIEVIEALVEDARLDEKADVIVNFEVIEHLFDPGSFLKMCFKLLKPGGFLVLTCPNIAGFETRMLGRHSDSIDHEHMNMFSPQSLSALAERSGLEVVEVKTPGVLDADIVYERLIDTTKEPIRLDPFLEGILRTGEHARVRFQSYLTEAGLSSNMMLIARAPKPN